MWIKGKLLWWLCLLCLLLEKGKQVTKSSGKYIKYWDYTTHKIKKAKVKISVRKRSNDGGTVKGKYYVEAWSSEGPINCKWIRL